jgi:hypothetical protein
MPRSTGSGRRMPCSASADVRAPSRPVGRSFGIRPPTSPPWWPPGRRCPNPSGSASWRWSGPSGRGHETRDAGIVPPMVSLLGGRRPDNQDQRGTRLGGFVSCLWTNTVRLAKGRTRSSGTARSLKRSTNQTPSGAVPFIPRQMTGCLASGPGRGWGPSRRGEADKLGPAVFSVDAPKRVDYS